MEHQAPQSESKQLALGSKPMLLGVISGIAEYFGFDVALARIAFLLLVIFTWLFPGVLFYILAYIVMKENTKS